MKIIKIKTYTFDELDEKARENALNNNRYLYVEDDWYEYIYEDADNIGLKITGFDIRGTISSELTQSVGEIIGHILDDHGTGTATYKLAQKYVSRYGDNLDDDSLVGDFHSELEREYLRALCDEYDHLTSDEIVSEGLINNEYLFTEKGEQEVSL